MQSQFRFDNECNISLPENHKRVRDPPPPPQPLDLADPNLYLSQLEPSLPSDALDPPALEDEATKSAENDGACVVLEDATPRGRRLADEAREVAAAHASLLVDIEACKRVSMARSLYFRSLVF